MKRTTYSPTTARPYYLNQSGSRAVSIDGNGNRETLPVSLDGETVKPRAVFYWEQCGNFSFPCIRVGGKAVAVFPDDTFEPSMYMPLAVKQARDAAEFNARFPSHYATA
jgi:hypothetical protein